MGITRYDYRSLEDQFIRGTMSIRELAQINGIPMTRVSSIHDQARKLDGQGRAWEDKRTEYQGRTTDVTIELLAKGEGKRRLRHAQVRSHAIEFVDRVLTKAENDLNAVRSRVDSKTGETIEEPYFRIGIKDVVALLDRLNPLLSVDVEKTSLRLTEERTIAATGPESTAFLGRLAALARAGSVGTEPRTVGAGPGSNPPAPREN
jgi:hypothetical protein